MNLSKHLNLLYLLVEQVDTIQIPDESTISGHFFSSTSLSKTRHYVLRIFVPSCKWVMYFEKLAQAI